MRDQRLLEEVDVATNQKGLEAARRNISNKFFEFFLFAPFVCRFFEARDIHTLKCLPTKTAQGYDLLILKT